MIIVSEGKVAISFTFEYVKDEIENRATTFKTSKKGTYILKTKDVLANADNLKMYVPLEFSASIVESVRK